MSFLIALQPLNQSTMLVYAVHVNQLSERKTASPNVIWQLRSATGYLSILRFMLQYYIDDCTFIPSLYPSAYVNPVSSSNRLGRKS